MPNTVRDRLFVEAWRHIGDTSNIMASTPGQVDPSDLGGILSEPGNTTTLSVDGITGTVAGATQMILIPFSPFTFPSGGTITAPFLAVCNATCDGIMEVSASALASCNLQGAFGPITGAGSGAILGSDPGRDFEPTTAGGEFYWTTAPTSVAAAPEIDPGSTASALTLLLEALLVLSGNRSVKKLNSATA
jgi:hypothetical protein